ncbi:hypothetical protein WNZ14_06505 [Hoeflea sp. AS60]
MTLYATLTATLSPFILGDATKAALAALVFPATWAMIARKGGF